FALTSQKEIERDATPEHDPFTSYVNEMLIPRLRAERPDVIGLSVAFPGQLQPAYSFSLKFMAPLPKAHLTAGGPAITQHLILLKDKALAAALGAFDSGVVFEGEHTLLRLLTALDKKLPLVEIENLVLRSEDGGAAYRPGHGMEDPKALPAP